MAYIPNNVYVYTAAFTGASSGIMLSRKSTSNASISYSKLMQVADAVAQAIDTIWAGTPTVLDVDVIFDQVQGQFADGFPTKTDPAFYSNLALIIIAIVMAAQVQYAAEGITPPPLPGTGGATLPITDGPLTAMCDFDVGGGDKNLVIGSDAAGTLGATYKFIAFLFKDSMDFGVRGGLSTVRVATDGMQVGNSKNFAITQLQPDINYHTGEGIFFFDEATVVPTGNPAEGIFLYVKDSLLRYRDPSGNIDTLGIRPTVTIDETLVIDWTKADTFQKTLAAGAFAFTFANSRDGQTISVRLTSAGLGSTATFTDVDEWPDNGTAPVLTSPSGTDLFTFINIGGTIYGGARQAFAP